MNPVVGEPLNIALEGAVSRIPTSPDRPVVGNGILEMCGMEVTQNISAAPQAAIGNDIAGLAMAQLKINNTPGGLG